jgi:hypothetical protein
MAGYANVPDMVGQSNADHPGKTFSHFMNPAQISLSV